MGLQPLDGRLVEAFDGFVTDEFVVLVAEVRDQILVLDDDAMAALPDRRHRSRLTKLRRRIAAGSAGRVVSVAEVDGDADLVTNSDQPDPGGRLVAQVRDRVAGKAALFVSNRDDPNLQRAVEEAFHLARLVRRQPTAPPVRGAPAHHGRTGNRNRPGDGRPIARPTLIVRAAATALIRGSLSSRASRGCARNGGGRERVWHVAAQRDNAHPKRSRARWTTTSRPT